MKAKIKRNDATNKNLVALEKKITNRFDNLDSDLLNFKDEILGEIRDMRDENSLITGRNAINRDTLENHETRIAKLETAFNFPK